MSKYDALWQYIKDTNQPAISLSFAEIEKIAQVAIDHSFLKYKKELTSYGYQVAKISMKNKSVFFTQLSTEESSV